MRYVTLVIKKIFNPQKYIGNSFSNHISLLFSGKITGMLIFYNQKHLDEIMIHYKIEYSQSGTIQVDNIS